MDALKELEKKIKMREKARSKAPKIKMKPFDSTTLPRQELLARLNWNRPALRGLVSLLNLRTAEIAQHINSLPSDGESTTEGCTSYIA